MFDVELWCHIYDPCDTCICVRVCVCACTYKFYLDQVSVSLCLDLLRCVHIIWTMLSVPSDISRCSLQRGMQSLSMVSVLVCF